MGYYYSNYDDSTAYPKGFAEGANSIDTPKFRASMESPDEISKRLKKQQDDEELEMLMYGAGATTLAFLTAGGAIPALMEAGAGYGAFAAEALANPVSQNYIRNSLGRVALQHAPTLGMYVAGEHAHDAYKTGYNGQKYNTAWDRTVADFLPDSYNHEEQQYYENELSNGEHYLPVSPALLNVGGMFTIPHPAGMYAGDILNEGAAAYRYIKNQQNPKQIYTP